MAARSKPHRIREAWSDRVFYFFTILMMVIAFIITLYPFLYVLSMSLSDKVSCGLPDYFTALLEKLRAGA